MTIVYRAVKGSNLSAAEIDGNFHDVDDRLVVVETNPPAAVVPTSASMSNDIYTLGFSDGQFYSVVFTVPRPRYRGEWQPATTYLAVDYFLAPDGSFGAVTADHVSAATFDWSATTGSPPVPVYLKLVGADGTTGGLSSLTDVAITSAAAGDMLVYDDLSAKWINLTPDEVTLNLSLFDGDTGSGGFQGLVPPPAAGDAAAGKVLGAGGVWVVPAGGTGGGSSALAGLSDVSLASLGNNDLLQYKSSDGHWHNVALSSIGGTITGVTAGAGLTGGGTSGSVSLALDSVADRTIIANISGTGAAPTPTTWTALLDAVAGSSRGAILRRDATGWTVLPAGSAGQYLQSGGSGADVSWGSPAGAGTVTSVATGAGLTGGPITGSGTVALASVADSTILSNVVGTSAVPIANTLTSVLDHMAGGNRGTLLYRGAASWLALAPGASGLFLQSGGTGADVAWAAVKGGAGGSSGASVTIWNLSARLATTGALPASTYANGTAGVGATLTATANAALTIDGTAVSVSDRVLVKDQAALAQNGVYTVSTVGSGSAPWVLTRASDFDQPAEILAGSSVAVTAGATLAGTAWVQITGTAIVVGTTSIQFEAITAVMPVAAPGQIIANPASFAAPAVPADLSAIIDRAIGSVRGSMLYRGNSAWSALGPGTAGQVLTTGGTGADPAWGAASGGAGTITGVTAGTGLTGGGTAGSVSLALTTPVAIANGGTGTTSLPRVQGPTGTTLIYNNLVQSNGTALSALGDADSAIGTSQFGELLYFVSSNAGAGGATLVFVKSRGSIASPTATQFGDRLGAFWFNGWGATSLSAAARASLTINATENWTDTAQGTQFIWQGTPTGGVATATTLTLDGAGNLTPAGKINGAASTTARAGLNLPHGAAPTTPTNGDLWSTTTGLFARINGVTVPASLPVGTGTYDQLVWSGTAWAPQRPKYLIGCFAPGVPTASQTMLLHCFSKAVTIPKGFARVPDSIYLGHASAARGTAAATASTTFVVQKATTAAPGTWTTVGSIVFAAGAFGATFSTAGDLEISFAFGDTLAIVAPATPDTTFAGLAATLVGFET